MAEESSIAGKAFRQVTTVVGALVMAAAVTMVVSGNQHHTEQPPRAQTALCQTPASCGREYPQTLDTINEVRTTKGLPAFATATDGCTEVADLTGTSFDGGQGGLIQHPDKVLYRPKVGNAGATYGPTAKHPDFTPDTLAVYDCP